MRENQIVLDTIAPAGSEPIGGGVIQLPPDNTIMDSILSIAESNDKK